jgi:hypothetical protein
MVVMPVKADVKDIIPDASAVSATRSLGKHKEP